MEGTGILENPDSLSRLSPDVEPGLKSGQAVGQIHFLERPDRAPVPITAPSAGILIATRGPALVAQGDCVACIAHDVDPSVWD
jgi:predicted deacylase